MLLQLFRANGIDIYSVWESMDLAGIGPVPAETIPERMVWARKLGLQMGPTPDMVEATQAAQIAQAQGQVMQVQMMMQQMQQQAQMNPQQQGLANAGLPGAGGPGAPGGPPQAPGGAAGNPHGGTASGGGRPPSGGQPPQMIQKGNRTVISESGR